MKLFIKAFALVTLIACFLYLQDQNNPPSHLIVLDGCSDSDTPHIIVNQGLFVERQEAYVACLFDRNSFKIGKYEINSLSSNTNIIYAEFLSFLPNSHPLNIRLNKIASQMFDVELLLKEYLSKEIIIPHDFFIDSAWTVMMNPMFSQGIISDAFQPERKVFDILNILESSWRDLEHDLGIEVNHASVKSKPEARIIAFFPDGTHARFKLIIAKDISLNKFGTELELISAKDKSGRTIPTASPVFFNLMRGKVINANNVGNMNRFIEYMESINIPVIQPTTQVDSGVNSCMFVEDKDNKKRTLHCE